MMLTFTRYEELVTMAGDDNAWTGIDGCSAPDGKAFAGYVALMRAAQEGLCAACGDALGNEAVEVCHVVGGGRRGYVGGNQYLGHIGCNDMDAELGRNVPLASLIRADLIMAERPSRAACITATPTANGVSDAQVERNARRLANMR